MFFCSKFSWNREEWHDRVTLNIVEFHLIENLKCVRQSFWNIREHLIHLLSSLKPFLFAIEHAGRVIKVFTSRETKEMIVCLCILLVNKMTIVAADKLHAIFLREIYKLSVGTLLQWERFTIGTLSGVLYLMSL